MRAKARCTSSPGLRALEPYFHRVANAAKRRLREAAPPLGLDASLAERRGRPERSGRIAPAAKARSMIRPTVDTLRWPPLRASMAWMRALPMNGYLRRTSITALTSRGFQVRCRTRRGRVDFGARPPIPRPAADPDLLQRAFFAAPRGAEIPARLQCPVALGRLLGHVFVRRDTAVRAHSHGLHVHGSGLLTQWIGVHWRLPDPAPARASPRPVPHSPTTVV